MDGGARAAEGLGYRVEVVWVAGEDAVIETDGDHHEVRIDDIARRSGHRDGGHHSSCEQGQRMVCRPSTSLAAGTPSVASATWILAVPLVTDPNVPVNRLMSSS